MVCHAQLHPKLPRPATGIFCFISGYSKIKSSVKRKINQVIKLTEVFFFTSIKYIKIQVKDQNVLTQLYYSFAWSAISSKKMDHLFDFLHCNTKIGTKEMINLSLIILVECGQPCPNMPDFFKSSQSCLWIIWGVE